MLPTITIAKAQGQLLKHAIEAQNLAWEKLEGSDAATIKVKQEEAIETILHT